MKRLNKLRKTSPPVATGCTHGSVDERRREGGEGGGRREGEARSWRGERDWGEEREGREGCEEGKLKERTEVNVRDINIPFIPLIGDIFGSLIWQSGQIRL